MESYSVPASEGSSEAQPGDGASSSPTVSRTGSISPRGVAQASPAPASSPLGVTGSLHEEDSLQLPASSTPGASPGAPPSPAPPAPPGPPPPAPPKSNALSNSASKLPAPPRAPPTGAPAHPAPPYQDV